MGHSRHLHVGCRIHHLDSDGDGVACEPTPVPGAEYVLRVTDDVNQYTY